MEGYIAKSQLLCYVRSRRMVSVMALIVAVVLILQIFTLPSRISISTHFPSSKLPASDVGSSQNTDFYSQSLRLGTLPLSGDSQNLIDSIKIFKEPDHGFSIKEMNEKLEQDEDSDGIIDLDEDEEADTEFAVNLEDESMLKTVKDSEDNFLLIEDGMSKENTPLLVEQTRITGNEREDIERTLSVNSGNDAVFPVPISSSTLQNQKNKQALVDGASMSSETLTTILHANESAANTLRKKKKLEMPPLSVSEMDMLLLKNRASRRSMRPRWSSAIDKQILAAKKEIEKAPPLQNDQLFFAPLFRDISKFRRSYELMEKTLKIYIYQEGKRPIFHQPLLGSIYASEGWFMKLMESNNNHYLVKDPRQAHLFYMPFSSRFLQLSLYARNSHNRTALRKHLKNYVDMIAAKYPFWNRTGGADHFLAACHDWSLYETKNTMDHSIRALCVADLGLGFQLGKDVCLPQTYVRSPKNPLKDLGGRPWNQRPILSFYAGSLHGNLRSILLKQWENKDPDMKIFSPSTFHAEKNKMNYIQYMKNSKYCICPRGYEANSPRLVESIFFECVPVIIADNYVPPFFEILNWEKFSVIVPEKDVPRLKEILLSIPESEYRELQIGVKKVQQHFLWHHKPVKYDLFHMILHSIWFNRVYNIKPR
ncbi:hypothetical protein M5K25_026149 [Dendrobium thyrsiflorum]|uniref:Exostosin GT47 domain-containing protein n=1 Tax=Dendrobium thyrsiflorum TaxID=117978 RepID=A0ABD0TWW6_DENTH